MWRTSLAFCLAIAGVCIAEFPVIPGYEPCSQKICTHGTVCIETVSGAICVPIKPGQCPKFDCSVDLSHKHHCIDECRSDYDCKGFNKCCLNCQNCRKCLKINFDFLCDNVPCGRGKECKLQLVPCIDFDCKPVPICVEKGDKIGLCPEPGPDSMDQCTNNCTADSNCSGSEKCCPSSCGGSMCTEPLPHRYCDDAHCPEGTECREVYDGNLVVPQCLENPLKLPQGAQCLKSHPLLQHFDHSPLTHVNCGRTPGRVDCPYGYKCQVSSVNQWTFCCRDKDPDCQPPCTIGEVCTATVLGDMCLLFKPGQCPKIDCPIFPLQQTKCIDECYGDYDCKDFDKCCPSCRGCRKCSRTNVDFLCGDVRCGRGKECKLQMVPCIDHDCKPVPICVDKGDNLGLCPTPAPDSIDQCTDQCTADSNCSGLEKCCPSSCGGSMCTEPLPHKSCDDAHCPKGRKCREMYDRELVFPYCLENPPSPPEGVQCLHGHPLLNFANSPPNHVNCGRAPGRMDCPPGYSCHGSKGDQWAFCCRDKEPDCYPPCGPDEECVTIQMQCFVPPCPPSPRCVVKGLFPLFQ